MKSEIEFCWPETGVLRIMSRGNNSVSLRYMPALDLIASELAKHRKTASNGNMERVDKLPSATRKHPPRGGK